MQSPQRMKALLPRVFSGYYGARSGKYAINYWPGYYSDDTDGTLANAIALVDAPSLDAISPDYLLRYACAEYDRTTTWWHPYGRQGY